MLKYIKNHLTSIDGIEIYPLISFTIFFVFFVLLAIYVFRGGKHRFDEVSAYPLGNDEAEQEITDLRGKQ